MYHITFDLKNDLQVDCSIYLMESVFGKVAWDAWLDSNDKESEDSEE